jgi:uncharacterized radical SAM protein YgiQ
MLAKNITSYKKHWASRFEPAPFLPMSRQEMDLLGWDSCDIIIVSGDAYVDHPSFGAAIIGRTLEAQGFRVGIIAQPDWTGVSDFQKLGQPHLFFGITAGNMDSMINHYTADKKPRSDDAYTAGDKSGKRPDRACLVYSQRCREAFKDTPIILGGIEASLRRIAHYDYWQDKVRRSILMDAKADLLVYGNAERPIIEIAHRLAAKESIRSINNIRGTAIIVRKDSVIENNWIEIDSTEVDRPGRVESYINPYTPIADISSDSPNTVCTSATEESNPSSITTQSIQLHQIGGLKHPTVPKNIPKLEREKTVIRLPSFEQVKSDPVLYAHANRVLHLETNPGNARALVQAHGTGAARCDVWINPPAIPLSTPEMDSVFDLPYARAPHPSYQAEKPENKIPAWEMIRFSVNIMRGCFGGCTFCSITEHEGRIIQSRSEESILREIEDMRDKVPGFTGVVSDLGGPTANMYRLRCKSREIEAACRKPSCVYPSICPNLGTNHGPLIQLYRKARALKGIKKILISSGLRYDLAVKSPEYIEELVTHHVGGYLKIAPEHTEAGPLSKMMKPGIGSYDRFKSLFEKFSAKAGKKQFLIPYFIAAHPGTTDEDMMNLALWLKKNGFRADQVQSFYPSPMATATAMYHSGKNPLSRIGRNSETVDIVRGEKRRRLHKAFLRYHDPENWPMLREALAKMGRADLIGSAKHQLVPRFQPASMNKSPATRPPQRRISKSPAKGALLTQHTGLPPRKTR